MVIEDGFSTKELPATRIAALSRLAKPSGYRDQRAGGATDLRLQS
jgi:hypothetical protein